MKRHESLIPLSHQHHDALILAQLIKKNSPPYKGLPTGLNGKREYTLNFFKDHLVPHFEAEELILIPFILGKNKDIDILSEQIVKEHNDIADLVENIRVEENVESNLDKLGNLITLHVRKEERELFEKIQEVFPEKKLIILSKQLSHIVKKSTC